MNTKPFPVEGDHSIEITQKTIGYNDMLIHSRSICKRQRKFQLTQLNCEKKKQTYFVSSYIAAIFRTV